jgi:hypothetical protein
MKIGLIAAITTIAGALAFATFTSSPAESADACVRTEFKTEMVRDACKAGGQKAAKDAMKKFNKDNNIKSCNQCHSKLAPNYENKPDAVEQFEKLGGKVIKGAGGGKGTGGGGGGGTGGGGKAPPTPPKK